LSDGACYIVGGGPSLKEFDFQILLNQDVIAINQSIFKLPKAKYFITTDFTWLLKSGVLNSLDLGIRRKFTHHPSEKYFVLALSPDRKTFIDEQHCIDKKFGLKYDLTLFDKIIHPTKYGGIGKTFEDFHYGSDSGYSALQLAVVLGYTKIYLLGLDFTTSYGETHYHEDYSKKDPLDYQNKLDEFLTPYPEAFQILKERGICVFSSSHISQLNKYILYVNVGNIL